jgi:hypothetical protein
VYSVKPIEAKTIHQANPRPTDTEYLGSHGGAGIGLKGTGGEHGLL